VIESRTVIVRRGHFATFELLTRTFADDPHVQIIWDRRLGERRQNVRAAVQTDKRRGDRRGTPPTHWGQLNYMITGQASG
jgi:ribosomal protein L4